MEAKALARRRPGQKGLARYRYRDKADELRDARISVRRWWWEYLRLSKDYWLVSQTKGKTRDRRLYALWRKFGDIHSVSFDEWWLTRGFEIFREQIDPPRVKLINLDSPNLRDNDSHVLLEIPLILRRRTVLRDVRKVLEGIDFERPRNVLQTSTSAFPINPVAYRLDVLKKMHELWCAHRELILKPKHLHNLDNGPDRNRADLFALGKRMRISPASAIRTDDYEEQLRRQNCMRATVSRYLRRANQLIGNVELGLFPVFKNPPTIDEPRFTQSQLRIHERLEEEWWSLDLGAML